MAVRVRRQRGRSGPYSSAILPRVLGVLLTIAGVALLTFASPSLNAAFSPYNLGAAMLGEGAASLWLLVRGVRQDATRLYDNS